MAQEAINNAREKLKYKRRNVFFHLVHLAGKKGLCNIDDLDKALDDFFESGIELREREKHLGK